MRAAIALFAHEWSHEGSFFNLYLSGYTFLFVGFKLLLIVIYFFCFTCELSCANGAAQPWLGTTVAFFARGGCMWVHAISHVLIRHCGLSCVL